MRAPRVGFCPHQPRPIIAHDTIYKTNFAQKPSEFSRRIIAGIDALEFVAAFFKHKIRIQDVENLIIELTSRKFK